jgi:hypothetical protein
MYAEESPTVARARQKLEQQCKEESKQITPEALKEMVCKIHNAIANQTRVPVSKSGLALFDGNATSAALSQKVKKIAEQLSKMGSAP